MKKRMKVLALVLAMAVALTGAGYAAWGSKITANTTLNSGTWDIQLENDVPGHSLAASDEVNYFKKSDNALVGSLTQRDDVKYDAVDASKISGARDVNSNNYVYTIAPEINSTKDVATFAFYNLHPGTKAITNYEIRNKGSIPAKVKDVTVKVTDAAGNAITAGSDLAKLRDAIVVSGMISKHYFSQANSVEKTIPAGTTLANLEATLEGMLVKDNFQLDPKTSADVNYLDSDEMEVNDLTFSIPINSLNGKEGTKANLKVSVEYDFVQYNVMVQQ